MLLRYLPPKFAAPIAALVAFLAMLTLESAPMLVALPSLLTAGLAYMLVRHLQRKSDTELRLSASEAQLKQRTAELTHQNAVLEMITHNAEMPDILEMLALLVEVHHPEMLCSILLVDANGKHLHLGAAPNLPEFYNKAIDGIAIGQGIGCCGTAAYTGERIVVEDIQTHPYWKNFRNLAQRADLRACWSQPIKDSGERIVGTFAIYLRQPAVPDVAAIMLIEHYAGLAALAIERTHSAEALRLHDAALNFAANAVLITDLQARIVWANHAFSELTGYEFEELIGKDLTKLLNSGHQDDRFYDKLWATVLAGKSWHGELINRRKDGSLYHDETNITPVRDQHNRITHFVAMKQDISARKEQEEHLKNLAFYDALTQLPNRRLLFDRLSHALTSCTRSGRYGAVLFLDLDNFKPLNDEYGHDTGDLLLAETAQRLTSCIRKEDTVSRFGGDEFVVLLKDLDSDHTTALAQATAIAEKTRAALAAPYRLHLLQSRGGMDDIEHRCTSSIGIALFSGLDAGADEILRRADAAMYRAKSAGRNTICFHSPEDAINGCEAD